MKPSRRVEMRERLVARDGTRCFYCRTEMDFTTPDSPSYATIEHLINRTDKGGNTIGNLALAGRECNSYADDRMIADKIKLRDNWPADAPRCTPTELPERKIAY